MFKFIYTYIQEIIRFIYVLSLGGVAYHLHHHEASKKMLEKKRPVTPRQHHTKSKMLFFEH